MGTSPRAARQISGDLMDFQTAVKTCFANYITFRGRAPRSEYWYFVLFLVIGGITTGLLDAILFPANMISPLNSIFSLVTCIPSLAVASRRLHDVDKSGWWQLLWFVPIVGWIIMIIWLVKPGTPGPNRFGEDPLSSTVAVPA
jgi:uncharacterized membrane protein YhaH (DUF805 family)